MDKASWIEGQAFYTDIFSVEFTAILLHEESAFFGLDVVNLDSVPCRQAHVVIIEKLRAH